MAINRSRKSSFERKCISKASKRLFKDASPEVRRMIDKAEKAARKLERAVIGGPKVKTND